MRYTAPGFIAAFFVFATLLIGIAHADNPVGDISTSNLELHLQVFATVPPRSNGSTARLNCLTHIDGRMFVVVSLDGLIYEVTNGNVSLFFDVKSALQQTGRAPEVTNPQHGGVRSVAFHPNFAVNGKFYTSEMQVRPPSSAGLTYLSDADNPIGGDSVVSEWTASPNGSVSPSSRRDVIRVGMPVYDHPIKQIAFNPHATPTSPDYGLLYITHGDGSVQSATAGGGRNKDGLGKVLRINPLQSGSQPYTVPADNPFVGNNSMLDEVYTLGHRNPHNLGFAKDGTVLVVDIGRDNVDEVNILESGGDYGWSEREGTFVHLEQGGLISGIAPLPGNDAQFGYTYPSAQVGHFGPAGQGISGQAICGGFVIENGSNLSGQCIYGQFGQYGDVYHSRLSELKAAVTKGNPAGLTQAPTQRLTIFFDHDSNPNTGNQLRNSILDVFDDSPQFDNVGRADTRFGQGPGGELYVMSKRNNTIYLVNNTLNDWGGHGYNQLSFSKGFESNISVWISSTGGNFPASQVQRNWNPNPNNPDEGGLGQRYMSMTTNNAGVGQYVLVDELGGANEYHILACQGYKKSGWAAFGITYYDGSWNEIDSQRQQFGPPTGSSRGNGDGMRPYSIGIDVPSNAIYAYIWVWNAEGGEVAFDEFQLVEFLPSPSTNLVQNGNFSTGTRVSNPFGSVRYSGQDFWQLGTGIQDDATIFHGGGGYGLFASLQMQGTGDSDLIYQRIAGIEGGKRYTLRTNYVRGLNFQGNPAAVSGIDFFDTGGNKVGANTTLLDSEDDFNGTFSSESVSFNAPTNADVGYVWVWMGPGGSGQGVYLRNISLEP